MIIVLAQLSGTSKNIKTGVLCTDHLLGSSMASCATCCVKVMKIQFAFV